MTPAMRRALLGTENAHVALPEARRPDALTRFPSTVTLQMTVPDPRRRPVSDLRTPALTANGLPALGVGGTADGRVAVSTRAGLLTSLYL